jgi:SAM-dependent methyltransferase
MTEDDNHELLYEMNPVGRFTDRAADYVKFRPGYPAAAIDAILRGMGEPEGLVAADVGAGTGISARLLADRGVSVIALEPNAAMRQAAAAHRGVEWREGRAEATGLARESVSLVVCAQAFHWFRQHDAVAEFQRILRAGGRLALMWNNRDRRDPLTRDYVEAIHAVNGEHPAELHELERGVIDGAGLFTPVRLELFDNWQDLDGRGLLGRALSASYVPREGPAFDVLEARLAELFERHRDARGLARMKYVTRVYLAERQ